MTQKDKELLSKDLGARLPYGVKVHAEYTELEEIVEVDGIVKMIDADGVVGIKIMYDISSSWTCVEIDNVKPYLFPLSSMTEEQEKEFDQLIELELKAINDEIDHVQATAFEVDFYNKYHFDWRGLIPLGLAIDATGKNIY